MAKKKSKRNSKPRPARPKIGRPKAGTVDWAAEFLKGIADGLHVRDAAAQAKVDGTRPYQRRETDAEFGTAWAKASVIGTRALESEAARRAYHGTLKPVYQQGEQVGQIREYSDTLIMFLLRARRPKRYRENAKLELSGKMTNEHINLTPEQRTEALSTLAAIGARMASGDSPPGEHRNGDANGQAPR